MHTDAQGRSFRLGRVPRRGTVALVVGVALLMSAASAIAAHPKKGAHFVGALPGPVINGFTPPVTFTVSSRGKTLTGFTYATIGCFSAGGFRPGIDYFAQSGAMVKVGTVKVSPTGHFSVRGVVWIHKSVPITTTITTSLSGSFTSPTAASGTITYSERFSAPYNSRCDSPTLHFTAKG